MERFERSEALEPFDKTQSRLMERLERTDPQDEIKDDLGRALRAYAKP